MLGVGDRARWGDTSSGRRLQRGGFKSHSCVTCATPLKISFRSLATHACGAAMVLLEEAQPVEEPSAREEGLVTDKEPSSQDTCATQEGGLEPAQPLPQSKSAARLSQAHIAVPQRLVPPLGPPRSPGRTDGLRAGWQFGTGGKPYIPKGEETTLFFVGEIGAHPAVVPGTSRAAFGRTLPTPDAVHAESEVVGDHSLLVRLLGTHKKAVESSPVKRLAARCLVSPPTTQSCSPRPGMMVCNVKGSRDISFASSMGRMGRAGGPRMAGRPGGGALWPGATAPTAPPTPPTRQATLATNSTGKAEQAEPPSLDSRFDEADVPPSAARGAAPLQRVRTVQITLPPSRSASESQLSLAKTAPSAFSDRASASTTPTLREGERRRGSSFASLHRARSGGERLSLAALSPLLPGIPLLRYRERIGLLRRCALLNLLPDAQLLALAPLCSERSLNRCDARAAFPARPCASRFRSAQ